MTSPRRVTAFENIASPADRERYDRELKNLRSRSGGGIGNTPASVAALRAKLLPLSTLLDKPSKAS